jgi:succinate dehydrogenase/fumarate reductase flavoprotein subunit
MKTGRMKEATMRNDTMTDKTESRRDFLKLATGGFAAVAAGALVGCSDQGGNSGSNSGGGSSTAPSFDSETEVLVLGGGTGGVFAAYFAATAGKKVTLVEAAPELGGTLLVAGGGFHSWNLNDPEDTAAKLPYADPVLIRLFMRTWIPLRDWLIENIPNFSALQMENPTYAYIDGAALGPGAEQKIETFEFMTADCDVRLNTRATRLVTNEKGEVLGAVVEDKAGVQQSIGAKATVIATGSFPANKEMITRYLGRWADQATIRATPYNTGVGIVMAQEAGALMSRGTGHFYGHMVPWPALFPQTIDEYDAADKDASKVILSPIQAVSVEGLAINLNGLRYTDESYAPYVGDNYLANETAQQDGAHAFVIIDSAKDREATLSSLESFGAVVEQADTPEELAQKMGAHGFNAANAFKTIREYQAAAAAGTTAELAIPKSPMQTGYLTKLDTPPYIAIQAGPGISGFYGGLKINESCQVLSFGEVPIAGLYAVPMTAGGIYYKEYAGALALCSTFGKIAGEAVAAAIA